MARINFVIPDSLHDKLRMKKIKVKKPIQQIIIDDLTDYLRIENQKVKINEVLEHVQS